MTEEEALNENRKLKYSKSLTNERKTESFISPYKQGESLPANAIQDMDYF